ncbi:MAG: hypothetical protein C5B54_08855 [Acidobacteria bacterium]|nr:MAG: hypothetical protein C5B54_08855 [Acidobacteriota bacterium]
MKALLLTAGLGTRLRPFTFFQAKATLPLMNIPFVKYSLQYLRSNDVEAAVLNLHSFPDSVQEVAGTTYDGMPITYSYEPQILGTAGAIRKASDMLGEQPFVVMNGDMVLDAPLSAVIEQHQKSDADVTLVIAPGEQFRRYGHIYFDDTSSPPVLIGFRSGNGNGYHYCGIQIVSPRILPLIPPDQKTDIFRDIYPQLLPNRKIHGYVYDGMWMEMGSLKEYLETSLELQKHPLPSHLQPAGANGLISSTATIEDDAVVENSIVMDQAIVQSGISVNHSIIGPEVNVTDNVTDVALARGILPWYL